MIRTLEVLYARGVLDEDAKLTSPIGFQVSEIPLLSFVPKPQHDIEKKPYSHSPVPRSLIDCDSIALPFSFKLHNQRNQLTAKEFESKVKKKREIEVAPALSEEPIDIGGKHNNEEEKIMWVVVVVVEATEGQKPHEALEADEVGEEVEVSVAPDLQQMKKSKKKTRLLFYPESEVVPIRDGLEIIRTRMPHHKGIT
ncbi:hypothetical protein Scep_024118 [Stephania cephalantha]|uniref:Uncharacterized protein n=1 Tax=Stephania cephalantha TaxID=152367 RepID=A0AAP0F329_9MAGN